MARLRKAVTGRLAILFREEIRDRQIALPSVIIESENPRIIAQISEFLSDRGESRAGRNADQHALLMDGEPDYDTDYEIDYVVEVVDPHKKPRGA